MSLMFIVSSAMVTIVHTQADGANAPPLHEATHQYILLVLYDIPRLTTVRPFNAEDMQGDLSGEHSSDRNEEMQRSKTGMLYPQFVESLTLLAIHAAERLRLFYPDIAGTDPNKSIPDAPKAEDKSSSRIHAGARRNYRSTVDKYSQRVPGVGSRKEARGRRGDLTCNKAVHALPAVQLVPGTMCVDQAKIRKVRRHQLERGIESMVAFVIRVFLFLTLTPVRR